MKPPFNLKDRKKEKYCKLGDKNETFALRDIKVSPDNPTNATVDARVE